MPKTLAILVLGAAAVAACASPNASSGSATLVAVTLSDTSIALSQPSVSAGKVTLTVKNGGSVTHSLVVLKTNLDAAKIPADSKDASKVDERGSIGATGQLAPGGTKQLTLDLGPGKYVLLCNEPAHYLTGMHVGFTVN